MRKVSATDLGLLVLRLGVGIVMTFTGSQKLLGAFGGMGFSATLDAFQQNLGVPAALGALAIIAEFFGGLGLILGLLSRVAAFGIACTMAVATYVHISKAGALADITAGVPEAVSGTFFPWTLFCGAVALMLTGSGGIAIDSKLARRRKQ